MSVILKHRSYLPCPSGTGLRKWSQGGTVARGPTTTDVALKLLNSRKRNEWRKYNQSLLIPGAPVSTPENARK